MARYREVPCQIWQDDNFIEFVPIRKALYFYLLTREGAGESGFGRLSYKVATLLLQANPEQIEREIRQMEPLVYFDPNRTVFFVRDFLRFNGRGRPDLITLGLINDSRDYPGPLWRIFRIVYPGHWDRMLSQAKVSTNLVQILDDTENRNDTDSDQELYEKASMLDKKGMNLPF